MCFGYECAKTASNIVSVDVNTGIENSQLSKKEKYSGEISKKGAKQKPNKIRCSRLH